MPNEDAFFDSLVQEIARSGIDPLAWVLGSARLVPSVVLIPAFGLRALPIVTQLSFAFILAAGVAPALGPLGATEQPWLVSLLTQLLSGLPVAVSAAITIWAATMTGNLVDELRGASEASTRFVTVDSEVSPLGVLFSLGAAVMFLELGGPARLVEALSVEAPLSEQRLEDVAMALAGGVQLAILIAGPLLAVVPFFELLQALIARAAHPVALSAVMAPLRAIALVAIVALLLDRFMEGVALWMSSRLPAG